MIDLTDMTVSEQLEAVAQAVEAAAETCQAVRANIPPELIMAGFGDPQAQLAMQADAHLRTIAAAIRSVIPVQASPVTQPGIPDTEPA